MRCRQLGSRTTNRTSRSGAACRRRRDGGTLPRQGRRGRRSGRRPATRRVSVGKGVLRYACFWWGQLLRYACNFMARGGQLLAVFAALWFVGVPMTSLEALRCVGRHTGGSGWRLQIGSAIKEVRPPYYEVTRPALFTRSPFSNSRMDHLRLTAAALRGAMPQTIHTAVSAHRWMDYCGPS